MRSSLGEAERASVWRKILEVRTSAEFHCSSLYWDTVDDCYGERTLSLGQDWRRRLPSCVDPQHCPQYSLTEQQTGQVCRVLTVFSFNNPDIPFLPLLQPITSLMLQAGLSEEEAYSFLSMLVSPASGLNINYFTQTRSGWDVLCFSLKPLAVKYVVRGPSISKQQLSIVLRLFRKTVWHLLRGSSVLIPRSFSRVGPGGSSRISVLVFWSEWWTATCMKDTKYCSEQRWLFSKHSSNLSSQTMSSVRLPSPRD